MREKLQHALLLPSLTPLLAQALGIAPAIDLDQQFAAADVAVQQQQGYARQALLQRVAHARRVAAVAQVDLER